MAPCALGVDIGPCCNPSPSEYLICRTVTLGSKPYLPPFGGVNFFSLVAGATEVGLRRGGDAYQKSVAPILKLLFYVIQSVLVCVA